MATYGGWTGKTLRVNLTTGNITVEDTIAKYKDYLGGTGVAYKVLWDEVPAGTKGFDEANKIIFGVGPLTGTGAPCGGRTSITTIFPTTYPVESVGTGHMGGHWGAELKYAGWDNVIIEGKSPKPVYLAIMDDKVEIRDAAHLWGNGIYRATEAICQEMGPETQVAAIGQAGENMVRMSVVINSNSHSAGGVGGVMGSKKLKAIAVRGTGSVKIAADKKAWKELNQYCLSLLGANNQHVVPSTPQPWAEYSSPGVRWTSRKGLYWGAANPPVETGECRPEDLNRMGFRTMKAIMDLGPIAEKFTVRMGGCPSCPIRCHIHVDVPSVEAKYGVSRYAANTCVGWGGKSWFKSFPDEMTGLEANVLGKHLADDYGVWCNYGQLQRDFKYLYESGLIKKNVPEKEYKSIPFDKFEKGDPEFLLDIYRRIAFKEGELGTMLGEGSGRHAEKWHFPKEYFEDHNILYWGKGTTKHHAHENGGQVGLLVNLPYNRDAQNHAHSNFLACGLPTPVQKKIAAKWWGAEAIDPANNYTPMNRAKAKYAVFAVVRKELYDSLTLCGWMWPLIPSPLKSRNYEGDITLEAQFYSLATGDQKSMEELDRVGERLFNLHRALTIRDWGTVEMREKHDTVPEWAFNWPEDKAPFTPGHYKMDKADTEVAKDMFYEELGWDKKTGAPTRATLERLGLGYVADELGKKGLLPA
ncbi:MAG: aldehyde ferredoxin oxidoreductase [Chitinophagales bacterium]